MLAIDGKKIAAEIITRLTSLPKPKKFFAGILIGDDPASASFQALKQKTAVELGIDYRIYRLAPELGNDGLREEVGNIARQKTCGGVIVQLPVPAPLNKHYIINAIPKEKDPDVLSEHSLGSFYAGRNPVLQPAAATVEEILRVQKFELKGKKVAVVGPGFLVGRPVAMWLIGKATEVYVLNRGGDMSVLKHMDLVVSGVGSAHLINQSMLKNGVGIIDFGYARKDAPADGEISDQLVGDFDPTPAQGDKEIDGWYAPVPGGTGPIAVAKLFENFYTLNKN